MARKKRETGETNGENQEAGGAEGEKRFNKTSAVLQYALDNPKAMPKEIAEKLTEQTGVAFTPGAVSTTLHQLKKAGRLSGRKGRKRRAGRPAKQGRPPNATKVDISDLVAAKQLAQRLGGVEKARQVLDVLAKLG